jgi:hypothetical protein
MHSAKSPHACIPKERITPFSPIHRYRCVFLRFRLIATDGEIQKRILWVSVTSNGVYSGYCRGKRDEHTTYHFDGNVFVNWLGEKPKKAFVLPSLKDLKGCHQLLVTAFTSDLSQVHDTPLNHPNKLDGIVNIDTRVYKRGIGCMLYMIKPNGHDLLGRVMKLQHKPSFTEIHMFLKCNPWISLVLYGDVYEEPQRMHACK